MVKVALRRGILLQRRGLLFLLIEFPGCGKVFLQGLVGEDGPDHFDGHGIEVHDGIVELFVGHFAGADEFFAQGFELESTDHIGDLVEGAVSSNEGAADFAFCVGTFVSDAVDEEVDALLWCPFAHVVVE